METLERPVPIRRRLFQSRDEFSALAGSVVIPCSQRRRRVRWVLLVMLLAGLWGIGMAGQLAEEARHATAQLSSVESGRGGP